MRVVHAISHLLGFFFGVLLLPLTFFLATVRNRFKRAFHPDGIVYGGRFQALVPVAEPLAGPALARFSASFVRAEAEQPDILGLAVRFGSKDVEPAAGAQDLLTASFTSFGSVERDKRRTNVHDYLDNDYSGVALYAFPGLGVVKLRWSALRRPARPNSRATTRLERLDEAVEDKDAKLVLEATQGIDAPLALGILHLEGRMDVNQRRLAFSPFRSGRRIRATGFLNGLRHVNYVTSRFLRGRWMR